MTVASGPRGGVGADTRRVALLASAALSALVGGACRSSSRIPADLRRRQFRRAVLAPTHPVVRWHGHRLGRFGGGAGVDGGVAPEAASVGAYDSVLVEIILVVGMIYGGASFTLHYNALRGRPGVYARSSEFRVYLAGIALATAAVTLLLVDDGFGLGSALRSAMFNVVTLGHLVRVGSCISSSS